jgi:hypothetical protein
MQHCTVHESLAQPPHVVIRVAPATDLVPAMAPTNADAAAILEHARRTAGAGNDPRADAAPW